MVRISSSKTVQKRFREGVPVGLRTDLGREREAADLLLLGPGLEHHRSGDLEGLTPGRALRYATDNMRRARNYATKYGTDLWERYQQSAYDEPDDLGWIDPAINAIVQANLAITAPGVLTTALEVGRRWDELIRKDRLRYAPFILYVLFLFAMSFAYAAENRRIALETPKGVKLSAEMVEVYVMAAIYAAGTANKAVVIAEKLGIDRIFRIGEEES